MAQRPLSVLSENNHVQMSIYLCVSRVSVCDSHSDGEIDSDYDSEQAVAPPEPLLRREIDTCFNQGCGRAMFEKVSQPTQAFITTGEVYSLYISPQQSQLLGAAATIMISGTTRST